MTAVASNYSIDEIVRAIPHRDPFRFIDKITSVDDDHIEGHYFLHPNNEFYKGHFPGQPITPGVILIEVMAQIGLVAFGLHLLSDTKTLEEVLTTCIPIMSSANVRFLRKVLPGEYVFVKATKVMFRHGKLICDVRLLNNSDCLVAAGSISGFIAPKD